MQIFEVEDTWNHVCKLNKDLYGLNQAPRAWYGSIDIFMTSLGFTKSKDDPNLYMKVMDDEYVILLLYGWMTILTFLIGNEKHITDFKKKVDEEFEMKDLGLMHYFLRIEVWKSSEGIFLNQGNYAMEILKKIGYVGL